MRRIHQQLTPPDLDDDLLAHYFALFPLWITRIDLITLTWDPASVAAGTTAEQTVSSWPSGTVDSGDLVFAFKPSLDAGLAVQTGCRVSAADTVNVTFINVTGGAIDPGSEDWKFLIVKA